MLLAWRRHCWRGDLVRMREVTGYELGLIGIVAGLMVGVAVTRLTRWGGWQYQALASCLRTLLLQAHTCPVLKAMNLHKPANSRPAAHKRSRQRQ